MQYKVSSLEFQVQLFGLLKITPVIEDRFFEVLKIVSHSFDVFKLLSPIQSSIIDPVISARFDVQLKQHHSLQSIDLIIFKNIIGAMEIDLLAILQKSLDRALFLYNFIHEVR